MRILFKLTTLIIILCLLSAAAYVFYKRVLRPNPIAHAPPTASERASLVQQKQHSRYLLGSNTNELREDNASIPFIDLFKSSIPFADTHPWLSSDDVIYDSNGWPTDLKGGVAGTKFLNRLPANTVPDGLYTVLYDGIGELQYGNDARLQSRQPGKDIIEITAGKDQILNASLIIKSLNTSNPLRNIKVLLPGGICEGNPYQRVDSDAACGTQRYLSFEYHHAKLQFNPDYLNFMKDFRVVRFMNMSGITRNSVEQWSDRNTLNQSTWAGKEGSRGAPLEVMVSLANRLQADAWFSMPHRASDDYIRQFAHYVATHLDPSLKVYIEYSNEVWNNIFIHRKYAIEQGLKRQLDSDPQTAGIKFYAARSVEIFKLWESAFGGTQRLLRTLSGWSANERLTSQLLSYEQTHRYTDVFAIAPYFYALPEVLRKAKDVDDVFEAMLDEGSNYGLSASIEQIQTQAALVNEFGVELVAYEGGQHLVDWETRTVGQHPNPLLYAANRDPRMGEIYRRYLRAWKASGAKVFVHFSAPRIYSWYGSWGAKEHIAQPREQAPKYDALLDYLESNR